MFCCPTAPHRQQYCISRYPWDNNKTSWWHGRVFYFFNFGFVDLWDLPPVSLFFCLSIFSAFVFFSFAGLPVWSRDQRQRVEALVWFPRGTHSFWLQPFTRREPTWLTLCLSGSALCFGLGPAGGIGLSIEPRDVDWTWSSTDMQRKVLVVKVLFFLPAPRPTNQTKTWYGWCGIWIMIPHLAIVCLLVC